MREYDELKDELKYEDNLNMKNKHYGFVSLLSKKFPSQVMVDLTEVCNLACIHCTHPEFKLHCLWKEDVGSELNKNDKRGFNSWKRYN